MTTWHFKPAPRRPGTRLTWFQSWLITNPARYVVAVAARRSGKTVASRALSIMSCLDDGPGDVGYMAPTLGQAKRLLWRPLMQDLRDPAAREFIEGKPNNSELTIEFKTGVRLYIYSAEAYERVRGTGFKLFITDESDDPLFTDEVFDESIGPALSDNMGRLVQIGTPKGRGRLFREYRKGLEGQHRDPEYSTIQVSAMEAGIIQKSEILRAKKSRPKRAFEQEYMATFNAPVGLVYDEWNEERHVVDVGQIPREFDEYIVGVDWGTANRGVMLVCGVDRVWVNETDDYEGQELARIWVIEEHAEAGVPYTDEGWWKTARQIQRQYRPKRWYCDPSGGSDEATAARAEGYLRQLQNALADVDNTARVVPADNRLSPGISAVQGFIHYDDILKEPPRLHVMDTCRRTIAEFNSYRWAANPRSEDEYEDRPNKVNDHCLVAGTVVATARGPVAIEDVVPGELVHTRQGLRPVLGAGLTQESAPIWKLVTSDGSTVEGTGNHLVWTSNRAWLRLDELRYGDILEGWESRQNQASKPSPSTGSRIAVTRSRRGLNCATTTSPEAASDCIGPSGSTITARFLRGITSTTGTATRSTTPSRTLNASRILSTGASTGTRHARTGAGNTSTAFGRLRAHGTAAKQAARGTARTGSDPGWSGSRFSAPVRSVAKHTRPRSPAGPSSARTTASLLRAAPRALTTWIESAPGAATRFASTSTARTNAAPLSVEHVGFTGRHEPVYDLTVDGVHEFYANGVLVHNCMDALRYAAFTHFYGKRGRGGRNDAGWQDRGG